MKNKSIGILIFCIFLMQLSFSFAGEADVKLTGTFSNLKFHNDSGDLIGEEIRIIFSGTGYQVIVQISEGGPDKAVLAPAIIKGNNISFEITDSRYSGNFSGTISSKFLKGILSLKSGNKIELKLPRKKSYWD